MKSITVKNKLCKHIIDTTSDDRSKLKMVEIRKNIINKISDIIHPYGDEYYSWYILKICNSSALRNKKSSWCSPTKI